ncbi:NAD(P)-binding protein [Clavulina sp. PMI_390]|nr:NAD(P)-binding protein [Clavulina sp. PMI_390]
MSLKDIYHGVKELLFPHRTQWTIDDTPDLAGRVMLITGGNSGIGKQTAQVLLERNAKVYITCRSIEKAQAALKDLKKSTGKTGGDTRALIMDLGDLATVKAAVREFLSQESRLDVLFNSAGVMMPPISMLTSHGHDAQFGTNVLGHFYLTQLLMPILVTSAKTSSDQHARIVNLSSTAQWFTTPPKQGGPVNYRTLISGDARNGLGVGILYNQSKAGNVLLSNALARRYGSLGVVSISVSPGNIASNLQRYTPLVGRWLLGFIVYDISYGAINPTYAATTPEALQLNGKASCLGPWTTPFEPRSDLSDEHNQEKLWEWCEGEVKKLALV